LCTFSKEIAILRGQEGSCFVLKRVPQRGDDLSLKIDRLKRYKYA
jgi:hypothetical protein